MKLFTNNQIRKFYDQIIERGLAKPDDMVESAAQSMAWEIMSRWQQDYSIIVFAGPGNNGADALSLALHLATDGYRVKILLFDIFYRLSPLCAKMRDIIKADTSIDFSEVRGNGEFVPPALNKETVVIDGLFGSGLEEPLSGGFQSLVDYINTSSAPVVSIDIPSGMFGENNEKVLSRNVIHATLTLAIGFPRRSFLFSDTSAYVGEWKVIESNLLSQEAKSEFTDCYWLETSDANAILKKRPANVTKDNFGSVMLVAGSYGMMGAAQLAALGCLKAGVGRLTVHSPLCGFQILQTAVPEAMYQGDSNKIVVSDVPLKHNYDVIAIGPGLGTHEYTQKAVEELVTTGNKKPMVLDADALNCIARHPSILESAYPLTILTPHAAEFERMFGESQSEEARLRLALDRAEHYSVVILLKGNPTIVVRPDRKYHIITAGTPALATPGSGDVLTGIISSLLAQGYMPDISAAVGALIHGIAGNIAAETQGEYSILARDIANSIGPAIKEIMTSNHLNQ